ncbi:lipopolysaccharide biosynthesis protein [Nocardioides sp. Root151]|uniref:lipopolysaccharide biosynthesis protein n=2 Tax=unclassified Nocardioides TaxID=2615069 RepID=UPI0009E89078|nr:lipopolysaccharide biosynthesis protein [Nocardioides sp. Root151]
MSVSGAMVWFAVSYAGAVLGFLGVNAVAARWLGPADFGLFVAAIAATGLLGQIGLVGSHRSGLREVARLRDVDDPLAMGALRNGVRAVNLTTLPALGLLGGAATWVLASDESATTRALLAFTVVALVVLCGQQQLWANYVRGLGHVRFASLLEGRSGGALVAALQAVFVLIAWLLWSGAGLAGALMAVAAGFLIPVVAARWTVHRRWRGVTDPQPQLWRDLRLTIRRDWRFLSAQVATYLNVSTEIWIGALLLAKVDASMFSAGQRLALLLVLPLTALQVVLAPVIARAANAGREDQSLEPLLRTAATVATGLSVVLALPFLVAPGRVVDLVYGSGFEESVPVLLLLALGSIGNVATGTAGTTLSMLGREGVSAQVQWSGALLRIGLGVPAALFGGLMGLTLSALAVSIFVFTVMWWRAHQAVGLFTHATLRPEMSLLRRTPG